MSVQICVQSGSETSTYSFDLVQSQWEHWECKQVNEKTKLNARTYIKWHGHCLTLTIYCVCHLLTPATYTHTQPFYCSSGICPGPPGWALSRYQKGKARKVKTNLDLLEQEIVSGSGICWAICKSAPHPRQPRPHPTTQFFTGRMPFLPQPTVPKH